MGLAELRRDLALIVEAREHRVDVWRLIIDVDGTIVDRIYRGSFHSPRELHDNKGDTHD
ncbi:MAG TPA: hypothetical protein VNJ04_04020 [Gemmatimonadaceae bacterium]|nr:hypothetical protein [Gemmatimonadaceae bacterium]